MPEATEVTESAQPLDSAAEPIQPDSTPTEAPETPADPASDFTPYTEDAVVAPEGSEIAPELRDSFLTIANDHQLPQEAVTALLDLHTQTQAKASEAASQAWDTLAEEWQGKTKADSEIGGDKLEPHLSAIGKTIDKYGSDELRSILDLTGVGNHPEMIRYLSRMAKDLTESGPVTGTPTGGSAPLADRLYPNMKG